MYIGYYQDSKNGVLKVSERINGKRIFEEFPLIFEYYVQDSNGYYTGYDGARLKKYTLPNFSVLKAHRDECERNLIKTYEMNFNIPNKVLYKHFKQGESPDLHKAFVDIEVDRAGYEYLTVKQLIDKACCPINAISIYLNWIDQLFTFMLCPETLEFNEAKKICDKFENCYLFDNENQLLESIIVLLDDVDVFAGWNSTRFDTPYIIRRIENILGKGQSNRLCTWDIPPRLKERENKFGSIDLVYEVYGKWFTDYMEMYIKHEQGKKESYSLNSIAEIELGEQKVQHDESLEDMYRNRYEDFIRYNRQDTMLVKRLDDKLKYIDIHNAQAHDIRCSLEQTMGTVGWVDQAIINEAHDKGLAIPDRIDGKNSEYKGIVPPGAFVPVPKTGLCSYIMSYDMNSLYPTTMRSINLSPETIVAQVQMTKTIPHLWRKIEEKQLYKIKSTKEPDWGAVWAGDDMWGTLEYQDILNETDDILTVKFEDTGQEVQATAKELHDMIWNDESNLSISAAGTIFRTDKKGLLNEIFTRWYSDRKKFKKKKWEYGLLKDGVQINQEMIDKLSSYHFEYEMNSNIEYDLEELKSLVKKKDIEAIVKFMNDNHLIVRDNFIESIDRKHFEEEEAFYDLAQYVKKIQLNSSYGALLNASSVFYDFRLGSSTTLSGRKVWQNLSASANEAIIGKYEANGEAQFYGDTDSCSQATEITTFFENEQQINSIKELYDLNKNEEKLTKSGGLIKQGDGKEVLCVDNNGELQQRPIKYIFKHKVKKRMYRIKLNDRYIDVTEDHSCMIKRDGKLISVKPKEIKNGDKVLYLDK